MWEDKIRIPTSTTQNLHIGIAVMARQWSFAPNILPPPQIAIKHAVGIRSRGQRTYIVYGTGRIARLVKHVDNGLAVLRVDVSARVVILLAWWNYTAVVVKWAGIDMLRRLR